MQRNSTSDSDGVTWSTAGIPLGQTGLDLRRPGDATALTELLNARFIDEKTVARRDGHTGRLIQNYRYSSSLEKVITDRWVYGHGTVVTPTINPDWESSHHPIHNRGRGTFRHTDTDLVWTGDRLLLATEDGPFWGASPHWNRTGDATPTSKGIPGYFPVQTDSTPPGAITGDHIDTCLTATLRVTASFQGNTVTAWITDRETGIVVSTTIIASGGPYVGLRVLVSGAFPIVLFMGPGANRNGTLAEGGGGDTASTAGGDGLYYAWYNGAAWSAPLLIDSAARAYDVCAVPGGFHLVFRTDLAMHVGRFTGHVSSDVGYPFKTVVSTTGGGRANKGDGPVSIAASPGGDIAVAWAVIESPTGLGLGLWVRDLTASGASACTSPYQLATTAPLNLGVSICYRGLKNGTGPHYPFVVVAGHPTAGTRFWELSPATAAATGYTLTLRQTDTRFNTEVASKSFRVGDEVFVWLRATNSSTLFLAAGAWQPLACGVADREVAVNRVVYWGVKNTASVNLDPLDPDGNHLTWVRPFDNGGYTHAGNALIGDLDFLPALSTARYGKGTYIAGSLVRVWDGIELGDAGFHDYPIVFGTPTQGTSGALTAVSTHRVRAYPVRYTKAGERFMGAAITSPAVVLTGVNNSITWTFNTLPLTNHDDVVFEVYRQDDLGAYRYEGYVLNNRAANTVTFTSTVAETVLQTRPGDSHETGVTATDELEEFGPLGCAILVTAGDRLWGVGGQVPAGSAQFSKLFEAGEGAGFDALAGTQILDGSGGAITSLAAFSDTVIVAFQRDRFYVLTGSGPDNYGQGAFQVPQLVLADGAINHQGTIVLPAGVLFWGVGGPRLLTQGFRVETICDPIRTLTETMTPSGVLVDFARREVVWYTASGDALLWNYVNGSRWARWTGLPVAGCSPHLLVSPDGRVLKQAETDVDDGRRFEFKLSTGLINPERVLAGATHVREIGMVGEYTGLHRPRFRVFYDGAPLWGAEYRWSPAQSTWLASGTSLATLTAAQVDALETRDRSGAYSTQHRLARQQCRYFRVEISDVGERGFIPYELTLMIGARPGLARVPTQTNGA